MEKAMCLLSGGMDSLVTLSLARGHDYEIYTLFINYGQKTVSQEEKAFNNICDYYKIKTKNRKKINAQFLKDIGGSALTSEDIDTNVEVNLDEINNTTENYVPFRNTILFSIATAYAETIGATYIYAGNEPDNYNPDNSIQYISAMQTVIYIGTKKENYIKLITPLINTEGKKEIIKIGIKNDVPFELSWSCYNKNAIKKGVSCGKCEKCQLRKKAFDELGIKDPLDYEVG